MPFVINKKISPSTQLAVWEYESNLQMYRDTLDLNAEDRLHLDSLKLFRQKEWILKRFVLNKLLDCQVDIVKDTYGKPFIAGLDKYISISHSNNMLAVIISDDKVGIDIQDEQEKIIRIAPKFLVKKQIDAINANQLLETLHYYWGTKESMFKAYGKKQIDFKKHLLVNDIQSHKSKTTACLKKHNFEIHYDVYFEPIKNYYLVYVIENN